MQENKMGDAGVIAVTNENRREAAKLHNVGKHEPKLTENGIPADVLEKLLPGNDIVELEKPIVNGGLFYRFIKRSFDVVSSGFALFLLAIPMAVIAVKIKTESEGPVIYAQRRVGKDGKVLISISSVVCIPMLSLVVLNGRRTKIRALRLSARLCARRVWTRFRSSGTFLRAT